jgi:hypothetical protein
MIATLTRYALKMKQFFCSMFCVFTRTREENNCRIIMIAQRSEIQMEETKTKQKNSTKKLLLKRSFAGKKILGISNYEKLFNVQPWSNG